MALPLMSVLGLASSAVNAVQKMTGQAGAKGGAFDAELATALNGADGSKNTLSKILSKDGEIEDEDLESLLGTPEGVLLFQFMTSLKEMGLSTADIKSILGGSGAQMSGDALKALLAQGGSDGNGTQASADALKALLAQGGQDGSGAQMSDDALKTLLSRSGLGTDEIEAILSNADVKSQLKTALGQAFTSMIEAQATKIGADPAVLSQLASSDNATIDEVLSRFDALSASANGQAQAGANTLAASSADPFLKLTAGLIQSGASHDAKEIRSMVGQIVGKITGTDTKTAASSESSHSSPEVDSDVAGMIDTAQSALGLSKDELKSLFFETDPTAREELASQVTAKIGSFLKAHEGETLSPQVSHALSYLKTAMSKTEFAGIDQALSLWNTGQTVPELNLPMDKALYASLAKNLGATGAQSQFEAQMKNVVDQLRQAMPSPAGASGGQVTITLHPPMLGKVDVSMSLADGQLQAAFKTDQLVTRDMLVQNMSILKEALADQGIKATQFSVSMSFDSRQQQGTANAMWGGFEKGGHGFGHQGRGQEDNGNRAYRGEDSAAYAQASYPGLVDRGLDFFA